MQEIADYVLVRELREGNHGRYYLARPPARLRVQAEFVMVKVVAGQVADKTFRRAVQELRAFASTRSPYLVRLFDAGQQDGVLFYAMEHFPLGTLSAPERTLARPEVLRAVGHAARAAHALHEAGVAHHDIQPDNVLLADDGARLSDLGLAHVLQPGVTVTGFGAAPSLEYVDPAVLRGGRPSRQSDVYSLGMTLHRALSGTGAFGDLPTENPLLAIRRVLSREPHLSPLLQPEDAEVVKRCLDPDQRRRPNTAAVLADQLEQLAAESLQGAPLPASSSLPQR